MTNETHDPLLRSWVESANSPGHDFPIQNLPFGVFRRAGSALAYRGGVAIGDCIVDLAAACERPLCRCVHMDGQLGVTLGGARRIS